VRNGQQQTFIASGTGPILTPSSLLVVPNGDLLIVSMFANEIHRYSSAGAYLGVFATIPPLEPVEGETNYPSDIAFDADGNILVAVLGATNPPDNRGQILRYRLDEGIVAGTLLETVVGTNCGPEICNGTPPIGSVAWVRSADAIDGDYNSDGEVDSADYAKWQGNFGKWVAPGGGADGDGNGLVDAADYIVWRKIIDTSGAGAHSALAHIPEPATAVHSLLLGLLICAVRRPNRKVPDITP
jgi:hypothetical protein